MTRLKLASVQYVNADPLTWGFRRGPFRDTFEVLQVPPSRIPDLLAAGRADAGLIPSIEYQRLDDVALLPYLCIASKRRARSVYLASRVPLDRVRRVALDENSRTSAALLRLVLEHRDLRDVAFVERAPTLREMLRDNDAALLIGDVALTADTTGLHVLDLAAAWHEITGLPFVFALWAVRRGVVLPDGVRPFLESRQIGAANLPLIAREAAARLRLPAASIEEYLRVNIHYHLGSEEARGLDLFYRQASESGLVPGRRAIQFAAPADLEPAQAGRGPR